MYTQAQGKGSSTSNTHLGPVMLHLLSEFCSSYCDAIDGKSSHVASNELIGGARIGYVFHDIFTDSVEVIDPSDTLTDQNIRSAIRNANGPRPSLFIPEAAFEGKRIRMHMHMHILTHRQKYAHSSAHSVFKIQYQQIISQPGEHTQTIMRTYIHTYIYADTYLHFNKLLASIA